jgi:hypothetical protein
MNPFKPHGRNTPGTRLPPETTMAPEHFDDDYSDGDPAECPECGGSGTDKWNDHILPCPMCGPLPVSLPLPPPGGEG